MIIRSFPDFSLRDHDFDAPCSIYGFPNAFILAENTDLHYPDHRGPLSILCNFHGCGEYLVRDRRYAVNDTNYLILNEGQRFANIIRSETPVESFHVWFQPGFAERVLRDMMLPTDRLLDDPERPTNQPVIFIERIYPHDSTLTPKLLRIRSAIAAGIITNGWKEEQFHNLLEHMLTVHRDVVRQIESIPAVRASTRVELYRRLHAAKDHIDGNIGADLLLSEMAAIACMSAHHFLRLFKAAFGRTPHQYLTERRLERARQLLSESSMPVAQVCTTVGFRSAGSFSWMFSRHVGVSPESYRKSMKNICEISPRRNYPEK